MDRIAASVLCALAALDTGRVFLFDQVKADVDESFPWDSPTDVQLSFWLHAAAVLGLGAYVLRPRTPARLSGPPRRATILDVDEPFLRVQWEDGEGEWLRVSASAPERFEELRVGGGGWAFPCIDGTYGWRTDHP